MISICIIEDLDNPPAYPPQDSPKDMRPAPPRDERARAEEPAIDRERHCPFLLRVFCNSGGHNRREVYEKLDDTPVANELHIYTWPDATLREITDLVQDSNADARKPNIRMALSIVSETRDGRTVMRKVGWVYSNRRKSADEDKTLASLRFEPGDFLDIALLQ